MPKVVATKPRRGVENTGRGGVRSIAEHETPVNCVNKSKPRRGDRISVVPSALYILVAS